MGINRHLWATPRQPITGLIYDPRNLITGLRKPAPNFDRRTARPQLKKEN